ncbi:MAG: DNA-processing protein DprA [Patescibacteria group bacterium]|jgi:DNA processing protein|nr:DNA-processing protein DprA [Patescibacteria group bacterium]
MNENQLWQIAFNCLGGFDFNSYQLLKKYFFSFKKAFQAKKRDLELAGLRHSFISNFLEKRRGLRLSNVLRIMKREGISVCFYSDDNYPDLLKEIFSPPPLIYYRGSLDIDWSRSLSVVGSRRFSSYGQQVINNFIPILVTEDIYIVSGLAIGIDCLAHKKTIDSGGITIAVLGSGLDWNSVYPRQNKALFQEIIEQGGLVLSEFCPQTAPYASNFIQRNRIIAGLSIGTLVIEAQLRSGSLVTARYALDEGRNVWACPGSIFNANSLGTNELIKSGAYLTNHPKDIYQDFI